MRVKYLSKIEMLIPADVLSKYKNGVIVPTGTDTIEVTEGEFRSLSKWYTGGKVIWEKIEELKSRPRRNEEIITEEI